MGNLLVNSGEILNHSTEDGETLTETDGVVMQKKEISFEFGDLFDSVHLVKGKFFGGTESGTVTEAGGTQTIVTAGNVSTFYEKGSKTVFTINDATIETSVTGFNEVPTGGDQFAAILTIFKDTTHWARIFRNRSVGNDRIFAQVNNGGLTLNVNVNTTVTSFKLKIVRSVNTFTLSYNLLLGAGWQVLGTDTQAIGVDCVAGILSQAKDATTTSYDFDYLRLSGTAIYWDTLADSSAIFTTYNTQVIDEGPGAIIQFGSASFDENSNMKYKAKAGTAPYSALLNAAGINALGPVVSDDGNFDLLAFYEGGTALAGWTDVTIPTIAGGLAAGPWGSLNTGIQRQIA